MIHQSLIVSTNLFIHPAVLSTHLSGCICYMKDFPPNAFRTNLHEDRYSGETSLSENEHRRMSSKTVFFKLSISQRTDSFLGEKVFQCSCTSVTDHLHPFTTALNSTFRIIFGTTDLEHPDFKLEGKKRTFFFTMSTLTAHTWPNQQTQSYSSPAGVTVEQYWSNY